MGINEYFNDCFIHCIDNVDLDDDDEMSKEEIFGEYISIASQMTREKFNTRTDLVLFPETVKEAEIKINEYYPNN